MDGLETRIGKTLSRQGWAEKPNKFLTPISLFISAVANANNVDLDTNQKHCMLIQIFQFLEK